MSLDKDTIDKLQSSTVRAALVAIAVNALALVSTFTGVTFDVEAIKDGLEMGIPALINLATIYLSYRAITGRVRAEKKIDPDSKLLPWRRK